MTLYMAECARDSIQKHSEAGYPNEICGVLLGREEGGRRTIRTVMPIQNSFEQDEQYHRFLVTPKDMMQAERMARLDNLDVLGIYHSHPNEEARPSDYDRDHAAWTSWSYIIVPVRDGAAEALRAWILREDRSGFDEEELVVRG